MKLAVILHLYYEDQLPEIIRHLQNLNAANIDYDLYITNINNQPEQSVKEKFSFCVPPPWRGRLGEGENHPSLTFIPTPNNGYDIGPFIDALHHINLNNYDYILKLHTKGKTSPNYTLLNNRRLNNALWGKILWNALLGSAKQIRRNIAVMEQNPQIGMLTARYCLTSEPKFYQKHLPQINRELQKLGFSPMQNFAFPAGSIFLARTEVLKPFLTYTINDFTLTNGKIKEGTLAHIVERLFGAVTITQGYNLAPAPHKTYAIARLLVGLKRFIYQKKYTSSGKTLIKICKIPVYKKS